MAMLVLVHICATMRSQAMPIDITQETLITFAEVARALPRRRRGRPVHVSTIHRWRSPGLRGVHLEAMRVGGAWCTTWEAFARFSSQLTARDGGDPAAVATPSA